MLFTFFYYSLFLFIWTWFLTIFLRLLYQSHPKRYRILNLHLHTPIKRTWKLFRHSFYLSVKPGSIPILTYFYLLFRHLRLSKPFKHHQDFLHTSFVSHKKWGCSKICLLKNVFNFAFLEKDADTLNSVIFNGEVKRRFSPCCLAADVYVRPVQKKFQDVNFVLFHGHMKRGLPIMRVLEIDVNVSSADQNLRYLKGRLNSNYERTFVLVNRVVKVKSVLKEFIDYFSEVALNCNREAFQD